MTRRRFANLAPEDWTAIEGIVHRARKVMVLDTDDPEELERRWKNIHMSLLICHHEACPLDLDKLMAFPDAILCHDIGGIDLHMCRDTRRLKNNFVPRCAAAQAPDIEHIQVLEGETPS